MKHFLKKLFYIDSPAHGALFSTVLFLIGSWILLSWAVLLGGFSPDCPGLLRENGGSVWKIYGIIELVLFFYLLFCGIRFGKMYLEELRFVKRWKWQIPATCCWVLCAILLFQGIFIFLTMNRISFKGSAFPQPQFFAGKPMVFLSYLGFIAMFAGIFCCAKIIENAAKIPWQKLFGKGSLFVLGVFFLTCGVTGFMAESAAGKSEKLLKELAGLHGELSAESFEKMNLAGRTPDAGFWKKTAALYDRLKWNEHPEYEKMLAEPFKKHDSALLAKWKKDFENDPVLSEFEKMFSAPLPAVKRDYPEHELYVIELIELRPLYAAAKFLAWKVRFAVENKNKSAAEKALANMENIRSFLCKSPIFLSMSCFEQIERKFRIPAVKYYVKHFKPGVDELKKLNTSEQKKSREVSAKYSIAGELIMQLDCMDALLLGKKGVPLRCYGWLLPSFRYIGIRNYDDYFSCFRADEWGDIAVNLLEKSTPERDRLAGIYDQLDSELSFLPILYPYFETGEEEQ